MHLVAVVKEDCPTCRLAVPALAEMRAAGLPLEVVLCQQRTTQYVCCRSYRQGRR